MASLATSPVAKASPVLVGTITNPTGINGIVVDGTTYDVTFSTTTLNSFTQGTTLSNDAASALNSTGVVGLGGVNENVGFVLDVDSNISGIFDLAACFRTDNSSPGTCDTGSWSSGFGAGFGLGQYPGADITNLTEYYVMAADFSVEAIPTPEPFTLSVFGAGIAGAVAMRRRKRKTA